MGAARGALVGSGAGIPLAFGVDFVAGSLAEQKIAGGRLSPVRAAVDGAFNAAGGRLYGTSPLRNAKDAFMRGALEGALKGGAYNIADVLDNKLRNAYGSGGRRNPGTTGIRNPWNKKNQTPWNSRNPRPTGSRCPQSDCIRPKPLKGMRNPKRGSSGANGNGNTTHHNDRFSLGSFVRDVVSGAVMGGLASVTFYGAGKAVEVLRNSVQRKIRKPISEGSLSLVWGNDDTIRYAQKIAPPTTKDRFFVIGHGSPNGIMVNGKEEGAGAIARRIRESEEFVGGNQVVILLSCETGKEPNGFAKQLANILGVTVIAPDKKLYPEKTNDVFVVGLMYEINGITFWDDGHWWKFTSKPTILRHKVKTIL